MSLTTARIDRVDFARIAPPMNDAFFSLEKSINEFGLDKGILEFIKLRASQMNGCAFCVRYNLALA
jgi:alkylhydroperoxidase family enzyme